jgi:chromosome segregation ATPase
MFPSNSTSLEVFAWIENTLQENKDSRWTAREVADRIQEFSEGSRVSFVGTCCDHTLGLPEPVEASSSVANRVHSTLGKKRDQLDHGMLIAQIESFRVQIEQMGITSKTTEEELDSARAEVHSLELELKSAKGTLNEHVQEIATVTAQYRQAVHGHQNEMHTRQAQLSRVKEHYEERLIQQQSEYSQLEQTHQETMVKHQDEIDCLREEHEEELGDERDEILRLKAQRKEGKQKLLSEQRTIAQLRDSYQRDIARALQEKQDEFDREKEELQHWMEREIEVRICGQEEASEYGIPILSNRLGKRPEKRHS